MFASPTQKKTASRNTPRHQTNNAHVEIAVGSGKTVSTRVGDAACRLDNVCDNTDATNSRLDEIEALAETSDNAAQAQVCLSFAACVVDGQIGGCVWHRPRNPRGHGGCWPLPSLAGCSSDPARHVCKAIVCCRHVNTMTPHEARPRTNVRL